MSAELGRVTRLFRGALVPFPVLHLRHAAFVASVISLRQHNTVLSCEVITSNFSTMLTLCSQATAWIKLPEGNWRRKTFPFTQVSLATLTRPKHLLDNFSLCVFICVAHICCCCCHTPEPHKHRRNKRNAGNMRAADKRIIRTLSTDHTWLLLSLSTASFIGLLFEYRHTLYDAYLSCLCASYSHTLAV